MKKIVLFTMFLISNHVVFSMTDQINLIDPTMKNAIEDGNHELFLQCIETRKRQAAHNPITQKECFVIENLASKAHDKAHEVELRFSQRLYMIGFAKDISYIMAGATLIAVGAASTIVSSALAQEIDDNEIAPHVRNIGIATGVTNTTTGLTLSLCSLKRFYDRAKMVYLGMPTEWEKRKNAAQRKSGNTLKTLQWIRSNQSTLLQLNLQNSNSPYGVPVRQSSAQLPSVTTTLSFNSSSSQNSSGFIPPYQQMPPLPVSTPDNSYILYEQK